MTRVAVGLLLVALAAAPADAQAPPDTQAPPAAPSWKPFGEFAFLLGYWSGTASSGNRFGGRIDRFTLELNGNYLVHRGSTVFPAEEGRPEETVEEVGYVSYDRGRRRYVASYFFSTGIFGTFDVEILVEGSIRLTAPALMNYESGARSRLVFVRRADGGLDASIDIAPPGKDFVAYLTGSLKKKAAAPGPPTP